MASDEDFDQVAADAVQRASLERKLLDLAREFEEGRVGPLDDEDYRDGTSRALLDARWALRTEGVADTAPDKSVQELSIQHDEVKHRQRLENLQYLMAIGLVTALFIVLAIGLFKGESGDSVGQFAAPLSGLAGIAIGWLFRDSSSRRE